MSTAIETIRTIDLGYEQLFLFDSGPQARVRVLFGATWLTEEGELGDAVIRTGDEVALHGGRVLIEALGPSRVQIVDGARRGPIVRAADALRRTARRLRARVQRLQLGLVAAEADA